MPFSAAQALQFFFFFPAEVVEIKSSNSRSETVFRGVLSFLPVFCDFSQFFRVFFLRIFTFGTLKRIQLAPRALMAFSAVRHLAPRSHLALDGVYDFYFCASRRIQALSWC